MAVASLMETALSVPSSARPALHFVHVSHQHNGAASLFRQLSQPLEDGTYLIGPVHIRAVAQVLFPSLKLGNNIFDLSRFARRCKQRQPQNMAHITSDLSVRK